MSEFTCYNCKRTFPKRNDSDWNDFKAAEEMLTLYPEAKNDLTDVLCDDCNIIFIKWFEKLTDEEKRKMREEYEKNNRIQSATIIFSTSR